MLLPRKHPVFLGRFPPMREQKKKGVNMFDVSLHFIVQLVDLIPGVIGIYVLFDLLGSLLFGKGN